MSIRLIQLKASNFKRLTAVDIDFDSEGNLIIVSGRNAEGKSSVLDAVLAALAGPSAMKAITRPIRDGETRASVFVDMDDFTVERTWREGEKPKLTVLSKHGAKYPSPQKFLDAMLGALSFDPLAFTQMPAKEQVATLLSLVELPFDPTELEGQRQAVFDERTEVGREIKVLQGQLSGLERPEGPAEAEIPVSAAAEAYTAAQAAHAEYDRRWAWARESAAVCADKEAQLRAAEEADRAAVAAVEALPPLPDLDEAKALLDTAEERNREVRAKLDAASRWAILESFQAQWEAMTGELAAIADRKAQALAEANMPIEGLSFDEEGVIYQGVPFSQASAAEQLRVSVAMGMAMNPTIRVMRIMDGSLLDSSNLALIASMAKDNEFQVLAEVVSETGELGIVIEDGSVRP